VQGSRNESLQTRQHLPACDHLPTHKHAGFYMDQLSNRGRVLQGDICLIKESRVEMGRTPH
jgi:hypothetical protein